MHAVVRRYTGAGALNNLLAERADDVRELLSGVPGFVSYHAIRSGDALATLTVCADEAGTTESTRRAAEWVRQNLPGGGVAAPEVLQGDVFIQFDR